MEILPQVTYTPDGILHVRAELGEGQSEFTERQVESLERLSEKPGVEIDDEHIIHTDVKQALGHEFQLGVDHEDTAQFVDSLGILLPYATSRDVDRVLLPLFLSRRGISAGVYPHFQRWLNTQSDLDENVARETITAMAVPFGKEYEQQVAKDFRYYGRAADVAFSFRLENRPSDFSLTRLVTDNNSPSYQSGEVRWNWIDLGTFGDCACFGAPASQRELVYVGEDTPHAWLYEMQDHNIDYPQQPLSLLMGLGTLARHASEYKGREDILEHAVWQKPRA